MSYTDKLKVELYDEVVNEKNKQYIELTCRFRETCNDIKKKGKENERLNKENKILRENAEHNDKVVDKVNWENKRLSNIISELEKEIKWQRKICLSLNNYGVSVCDILLNKLQELKGSDKE